MRKKKRESGRNAARSGGRAERGQTGQWPEGTLLSALEPSTRARLLQLGTRREYDAGQILLLQGERSTHAILLLDACVKVTATTEDGHLALLAIRVGGDIVGELASLDGRPRLSTVTAARPSVVRVIQQSEFIAFLSGHPDAALAVGRTVAEKLRFATRRRIDFGGCEVKVRLARVLVELADTYGRRTPEGLDIGVSLTQPELAALVGAGEPTVHKALAQLRSDGVVATGYRRTTVLDANVLRTQAGLSAENP